MKTSYFLTMGLLCVAAAGSANASHFYANSISMNNIATIQDSILHNAIHTFDRVPAANLGGKKKTMMPPAPKQDFRALYGTMSIYGEYDESEFSGRSGGDGNTPMIKNAQLSWQHFGDDVALDNYGRMDSKYDIAMLGLTGGRTRLWDGVSGWATYAGFINSNTSDSALKIDGVGGYAGIYSRFNMRHFNLSATINGGVLTNDAEFATGTDKYTNMWAGAAANASINIILDETFALQPGIQVGYTWIESDSYISISGDSISNSDLGAFQIAPALHAIKNIGDGWFGTAHIRYVATMGNGGELSVNSIDFETLEYDNYTEYGLSLEKTVGRFNLSGTIVRRDGGHDGWGGGLNIKYIF